MKQIAVSFLLKIQFKNRPREPVRRSKFKGVCLVTSLAAYLATDELNRLHPSGLTFAFQMTVYIAYAGGL